MAEIGSTLREARMRARIDISEVEARTKIRAKYLRAIENEEWDLLPGAVYVKSFLRTYGDFLGLDSRLLIDEFKRRYERPDDHEARTLSSMSRERERERRSAPRRSLINRSMSPRIVIAAALVVIVVALIELGNNNPGAGGGAVKVSTTRTTPPHHHGHKPTKGKGSGRGTTTGTTHHTTTTGTTPTNTAKVASVQMVATNSVWVCIRQPGVKVWVPGLVYTTGEKVPSATGRDLLVRLGNGNVSMTVNGHPYTVTRSPNVIGLKITAAGVKVLNPAPACG